MTRPEKLAQAFAFSKLENNHRITQRELKLCIEDYADGYRAGVQAAANLAIDLETSCGCWREAKSGTDMIRALLGDTE